MTQPLSLVEHIEQVKIRLAHCEDAEEAATLYADCRLAEDGIAQLTNIAGDVAERLTRRTLPAGWHLRMVQGGRA